MQKHKTSLDQIKESVYFCCYSTGTGNSISTTSEVQRDSSHKAWLLATQLVKDKSFVNHNSRYNGNSITEEEEEQLFTYQAPFDDHPSLLETSTEGLHTESRGSSADLDCNVPARSQFRNPKTSRNCGRTQEILPLENSKSCIAKTKLDKNLK